MQVIEAQHDVVLLRTKFRWRSGFEVEVLRVNRQPDPVGDAAQFCDRFEIAIDGVDVESRSRHQDRVTASAAGDVEHRALPRPEVGVLDQPPSG
jgi:hypothetical protein